MDSYIDFSFVFLNSLETKLAKAAFGGKLSRDMCIWIA